MTDFENEEYFVDPVEEENEELPREFEDDVDDGDDVIPELYFCNSDPFSKRAVLPEDYPRRNYRIDEEGHIIVRNLSGYWIPELTVTKEIDGTIYTVSGSYEGKDALDKKLARIMLHNLEDS